MFNQSKNFVISGGNFNNIGGNQYNYHYESFDPDRILQLKLDPKLTAAQGHKECIKNTRVTLLSNLVGDLLHSNIVLLYGRAGTGKSSIAGSLAEIIRTTQDARTKEMQLGTVFLCNRTTREDDVHTLVPTLAYYLASVYPAFKDCLAALATDAEFDSSGGLKKQFQALLASPLLLLWQRGKISRSKIVFIIDALDEWGCEEDRKLLIIELKKLCHDYQWIQFLITSRPNSEIMQAFSQGQVGPWRKRDISQDNETEEDIKTFFHEFRKGHEEVEQNITEHEMMELLPYVDSLFQLADVVCKFLIQKPTDPRRKFKLLINADSSIKSSAYTQLYTLYEAVVKESIEASDVDVEQYMDVLQTILMLQKPVKIATLQSFTNSHAPTIVDSLSAVLYRDSKDRVHYHMSFQEFIMEEGTVRGFPVNAQEHHKKLLFKCLDIMNQELRFNICCLESSYILNKKVQNPEMKDRVQMFISEQLSYSCESWIYHLCQLDNKAAWEESKEFLQSKKMIYWMECLSCLGESSNIRNVGKLIQANKNAQIVEISKDISKFISAFYIPISQSTPHLYLSALAMVPQSTWLSQAFTPYLHKTVKIRQDGCNRYWDALILKIEVNAEVKCIAHSPTRRVIASGSSDGNIRIWSTETGQPIGQSLQGHKDYVRSVAFSPDGTCIASGSDDKTIRLWDSKTGKQIGSTLQGSEKGSVRAVVYSPDGRHIISGSDDGYIRIWQVKLQHHQPSLVKTIPAHGSSNIRSLAYSPNGHYIVSGSDDWKIRVWDVETGERIHSLKEHTGFVRSVIYSPDGNYILSGSDDRTIRIWRAKTGQPLHELKGHEGYIRSVAYSPDGKYIISGSDDKTIRIWDSTTGNPIGKPMKHRHYIRTVSYSPDGAHIISGSDDETIRIWNTEVEQPVQVELQGHGGAVRSVAYHPNGKCFISGSYDETIRIWNAETGQPIGKPLVGHTECIRSVVYSPNGMYIISGSDDKTIRVWNSETRDQIGSPLRGHKDYIRTVSCSPDSSIIVSGSDDGKIRLWDLQRSMQIRKIDAHSDYIRSVAYHPNGIWIVSGADDHKIRIWDVETGEQVRGSLKGAHKKNICSVTYSCNGDHILSSSDDSTMIVWNAYDGNPICTFEGHKGRVLSAVYSPTAQSIASGSTDCTVRLWNTETTDLIEAPFQGHGGYVRSVAFSPDGKFIISGSDDQTIRMWSVEASHSHAHSIFSKVHVNAQGWLTSDSQELIVWVPPQYRSGIINPQQILTIPADAPHQAVHVNMLDFAHGRNWQDVWFC